MHTYCLLDILGIKVLQTPTLVDRERACVHTAHSVDAPAVRVARLGVCAAKSCCAGCCAPLYYGIVPAGTAAPASAEATRLTAAAWRKRFICYCCSWLWLESADTWGIRQCPCRHATAQGRTPLSDEKLFFFCETECYLCCSCVQSSAFFEFSIYCFFSFLARRTTSNRNEWEQRQTWDSTQVCATFREEERD